MSHAHASDSRCKTIEDRSLPIELIFGIRSIIAGREKDFVRQLSEEDDPSEAFEATVRKWNEGFVSFQQNQGYDAVTNFDAVQSAWEDFLSNRLEIDLGLDATVEVRLPGYNCPFDLSRSSFVVYAHDSDEAVNVDFRIGLDALKSTDAGVAATYLPEEQLEEKIEEEIKRLISEKIGLHTLLRENEKRKELIRAHLEVFLKDFGLRILHLVISPASKAAIQLPPTLTHRVCCNVEPKRTEVEIEHSLILSWNNLAKLRKTIEGDREAVEKWIKQLLEHITQGELFDKSYVDLVLDFDVCRNSIRKKVYSKLQEIGCNVRQLVTIPKLEHLDVIEKGLTINLETDPEDQSSEYLTKDSRVNFGLRLTVDAEFDVSDAPVEVRIGDDVVIDTGAAAGNEKVSQIKEKLRSLITPEMDFEVEFRKISRAAAQSVIQKLSPERLYLLLRNRMARLAHQNNKSRTESPND